MISLTLYVLYYQDNQASLYYSVVSPPPKHMLVVLGGYPLLLMACFLCFMGRNLLTRDEYYRIHEVVDARPVSNFRLLTSKIVALVVVGWIPMAVFSGIIELGAWLQNFMDFNWFERFDTVALLKFLLFTCPVSLSLVAVLSLLFNVLFRNNLLTMAALLGIVIGGYVLITKISLSQYIYFEGLPLVGYIGSELDPEQLAFIDIVRYVSYLATVLFLFLLAVVFFRRRDDFVRRDTIACSTCGVVLVLCISTSTIFVLEQAAKMQQWTQFQDRNTVQKASQLDIIDLNAEVHVEPARRLSVNAELSAIVLSDTVEDVLVLWLNPGFSVAEVKLDDVGVSSELDNNGRLSLRIAQPLEAGQRIHLSVSYQGKPDLDFGYFDSSTDVSKMPKWDQLLSYMGDVHGIYSSKFVALPQELMWFPTPVLPLYELRAHKDFFDSTIQLTLPEEWEAAVSGRRLSVENDGKPQGFKTYEFKTEAPVSSLDLYAGPFRVFSQEIAGVNFEVLLTEQQLSRVAVIQEHLEILLDELAEQLEANIVEGFEFPCSDYRFVSVPQRLRVYGGGAFLNLLLSSKCSYLLREFDVFSVNWENVFPDFLETWGMDRGTFLVQVLKNYFRFNFQGTNVQLDLFNSYWDHELGIVGPEAESLSLVLAYLNDLVWYDSIDGFSASGYFPKAMKSRQPSSQPIFLYYGAQYNVNQIGQRIFRRLKPFIRHIDIVEGVMSRSLATEEVQQVAIESSMQQTVESELDPFLVETLRLRCAHLSFQLFQVLGKEDTRLLFDALLARYRHTNFNVEDLYATSAHLGLPVEEILGDWFASNEQPEYAFSSAVTYKREANEDGEEEYQTNFHILNQGERTGTFRTSVTTVFGGFGALTPQLAGDSTFIAADMRYGTAGTGPVVFLEPGESVEVGIVSEREPIRVVIQPLNLSVGGGRVAIPARFIEDTRDVDPVQLEEFHGFRKSSWVPPPSIQTGIVVDDLDPSVTVENGKHIDDVKTWRRVDYPSAWGSSRRTMVYCESKNPKKIEFKTDLPHDGMWGLEFHLPDLRGQFGDFGQGLIPRGRISMGGGTQFFWQSIAGEYKFTLEAGNTFEEINVNVSQSDFGWIRVADIQLNQGSTIVSVEPSSDDEKLFGDAIRWIHMDAGE